MGEQKHMGLAGRWLPPTAERVVAIPVRSMSEDVRLKAILAKMGVVLSFQKGTANSYQMGTANLTGFTVDAGPPIEAKRVQLLRELRPGATRIAYFCPQGVWDSANGPSARRAAAELGLELHRVEYASRELAAGLEMLRDVHPDCVLAARHPTNIAVRDRLAGFALEHRLPLLGPSQEFAGAGALLSYGPSVLGLWRQLAGLTARLLEGTAPGDIPVQQPIKFELVVNLKAARAIGLEVAPSILIRADEVIE